MWNVNFCFLFTSRDKSNFLLYSLAFSFLYTSISSSDSEACVCVFIFLFCYLSSQFLINLSHIYTIFSLARTGNIKLYFYTLFSKGCWLLFSFRPPKQYFHIPNTNNVSTSFPSIIDCCSVHYRLLPFFRCHCEKLREKTKWFQQSTNSTEKWTMCL